MGGEEELGRYVQPSRDVIEEVIGVFVEQCPGRVEAVSFLWSAYTISICRILKTYIAGRYTCNEAEMRTMSWICW
jgi:hypothetical protein